MTSRAIEVRVLGDAYQLEAALGKASKSLAQFGGDANAAAEAQVRAGVRSREDLAKLAAAYEKTAAASVKGSDEEIVAARKAAEARAQLARTSVVAANEESAAWGKASAGVIGFAKQAALFGAGYLGFQGLKDSLDAVLGAQTSIAQRNQAIKAAHADLQSLLPILERYEELARIKGFTDEQTRDAEAKLVTAFGATKHSLGELRVAEDLARKSHEDLGTATRNLILLQEGNTRAAKQYGLALPDLSRETWRQKAAQDGLTVSQEKGKFLYDELLPRIKGQSDAFANTPVGKLAEFHAELQKIEESIGEGLLPTVDHYLTVIDAWMAKSANQKRITHDVEAVVHTLATVLHDAYEAGDDFLKVTTPIAHELGGWKRVIEALIALKFASVVAGWIGPIGGLIGGEGKGLVGAEAASGGLLRNLKSLAALRVIAVVVELDILKRILGDDAYHAGTHPLSPLGPDIAPDVFEGKNPYPKGTTAYYEWEAGHRHLKAGTAIKGSGGLHADPNSPAYKRGASAGDVGPRIVAAGKAYGGTGGGTYQSGGGHTSGRVKVGSALDCSGFVYQSLLAAGVKGFSYGNAASQFAQLKRGRGGNWVAVHVGLNDAEPGDIVYWDNRTSEPQPAHCGIVVSGSGAGSRVMQYEDPKDGSGIGPINELPIWGIFRVKIVKGGAGGGSPYGPSTAGTAASQSNYSPAASSSTPSASTGSKETASSVSAWVHTMLSHIEARADAAFERQTAAHIRNVLMPRFFQGTDASGKQRLTPAEAQLAAMQAEDTSNSLQQALRQAQASGDQTAIAAAQRAIQENDLATKATAERAKADADYAKAVRKYEAERAQREKALNASLLKFVENLAKGTVAIGGLVKVLERYGLDDNTVRVHVPHHHGKHHHHHAVGSHTPPDGHPKKQTIILEFDGRRLASAQVPRNDQVVRLKLS